MDRNKTLSLCANPFSVWTDMALKTCEMMVDSAEIIGHRAGLMAVAGPIPNASDQREFALMGQEKIEAAAESARAMAEFVMTMNRQLAYVPRTPRSSPAEPAISNPIVTRVPGLPPSGTLSPSTHTQGVGEPAARSATACCDA